MWTTRYGLGRAQQPPSRRRRLKRSSDTRCTSPRRADARSNSTPPCRSTRRSCAGGARRAGTPSPSAATPMIRRRWHGYSATPHAWPSRTVTAPVTVLRRVGTRVTIHDEDDMSPLVVRATSGVVLRDADGRVPLMRRATEDKWGIPGGGVEAGESWSDAALRECREETGWAARIDDLLGVYSDPSTQVHRYPNGALRQFVGVVFWATALRHIGSGQATARPSNYGGSPPTTYPRRSSPPTCRCSTTHSTPTYDVRPSAEPHMPAAGGNRRGQLWPTPEPRTGSVKAARLRVVSLYLARRFARARTSCVARR